MTKKFRKRKLGRRIAASRLKRGVSQRVTARRAGIDPSYLSRIETGKVHPTVGTAMRIAKALNLSLDDLFGPTLPEEKEAPCPLSPSGECFLDLVEGNHGVRGELGKFSARQIRLLRRIVRLVDQARPSVLRSLEVLIGEILEAGARTGRSR